MKAHSKADQYRVNEHYRALYRHDGECDMYGRFWFSPDEYRRDRKYPSLSKACLGRLLVAVLKNGGTTGQPWAMYPGIERSVVMIPILCTIEAKIVIERETGLWFAPPPRVGVD